MTVEIKPPQSNGLLYFVKRITMLLTTLVLCICGLAIFVPGPIQKSAYMGAQYCGSCHQAEFKSWALSPHNNATKNLPLDKKNDVACLSCHATGVFERGEASLPGVQCEACHGPGQYYASLHVKKDPVLSKLLFMQTPAAKSCSHCHLDAGNLWSPHHGVPKNDHLPKSISSAFHGMSDGSKYH